MAPVATDERKRSPLSERQLDKRIEVCPNLDADEIQEAHLGPRVVLFNLSHLHQSGRDYDGLRYDARPRHKVEVTERKATELLAMRVHFPSKDGERGRHGPAFERYDHQKHGK